MVNFDFNGQITHGPKLRRRTATRKPRFAAKFAKLKWLRCAHPHFSFLRRRERFFGVASSAGFPKPAAAERKPESSLIGFSTNRPARPGFQESIHKVGVIRIIIREHFVFLRKLFASVARRRSADL
jgi:hypothetical protein